MKFLRSSTIICSCLLLVLGLATSLTGCDDDPLSSDDNNSYEAEFHSPFSYHNPASTPFVVRVTADRPLDRVEFDVDGEVLAVDREAPFEFLWNIALWADGERHAVHGKPFDTRGVEEYSGYTNQLIPLGTRGVLVQPAPTEGQADTNEAAFKWRMDPMASGYDLEVCPDLDFEEGVLHTQATDTTTTMSLESHRWYNWHVRSHWPHEQTAPWSEIGAFYTGPIFNRQYPYHDVNSSRGEAVAQATDGGYLVAGFWNSGPGCFVQKFDALGDPDWLFTPYLKARFNQIVATEDGGCLVVGASYSSDPTKLLLLKLDADGREEWRRDQYGSAAGSSGRALISCSSGGYLAAGSNAGQAWLLRLDEQGRQLWESLMEPGAFSGVIETPTGHLVATGSSESADFLLAEVDESGETVWLVQDWGLPGQQILVIDSGYLVLASDSFRASVLSFDAGGNEIEELSLGYEAEYASVLLRRPHNEFLICGESLQFTVNSSLEILDQGPLPGTALGHAATADGGFILTGKYFPSSSLNTYLWLLKANPAGEFEPPEAPVR